MTFSTRVSLEAAIFIWHICANIVQTFAVFIRTFEHVLINMEHPSTCVFSHVFVAKDARALGKNSIHAPYYQATNSKQCPQHASESLRQSRRKTNCATSHW